MEKFAFQGHISSNAAAILARKAETPKCRGFRFGKTERKRNCVVRIILK